MTREVGVDATTRTGAADGNDGPSGGSLSERTDAWKRKELDVRPNVDSGKRSDNGGNDSAVTLQNRQTAAEYAHQSSGVESGAPPVKLSDQAAKNATIAFIFSDDGAAGDRVTALQRLYASGVKEIEGPDGKKARIEVTKQVDGNKVSLVRHEESGDKTLVEGTVDQTNNVANARSEIGDTTGARNKGSSTAPEVKPGVAPTGKPDVSQLFDSGLSLEEKLKVAQRGVHDGKNHVTGPDGKRYDISAQKIGGVEEVSVFAKGSDGKDHVVIRGLIGKDGKVIHERDLKGNELDLRGNWFSKHDKNNPLLKDATDKHTEPPPPPPETPTQRLERDAKEKMSEKDSAEFIGNMRLFEDRAKKDSLPPEEVSKSYEQLSKLLEATEAKVTAQDRVLAAQSFMLHAAVPDSVYQGQHNTCNVTVLEMRNSMKRPSVMAEMLTEASISGEWTAKDGKKISLDPRSLVPGVEERNFPSVRSGDRTFSTQILNTVLINDSLQRRVPPEIYWQDRPSGPADSGERRRYLNTGEMIQKKDAAGNMVPVDTPGLYSIDISRVQTRINGETKFLIEKRGVPPMSELVQIESKAELNAVLKEMKEGGRFPAVLFVDANHPTFGGDNAHPGKAHVVSVTDYDPTNDQVYIVNQWGWSHNKWMPVQSVYEATSR